MIQIEKTTSYISPLRPPWVSRSFQHEPPPRQRTAGGAWFRRHDIHHLGFECCWGSIKIIQKPVNSSGIPKKKDELGETCESCPARCPSGKPVYRWKSTSSRLCRLIAAAWDCVTHKTRSWTQGSSKNSEGCKCKDDTSSSNVCKFKDFSFMCLLMY